MKQGYKRFEYYLIQLEALLAQAGEEKNPAQWLYENDARTCFFMLESLSRMYKSIHGKKGLNKINNWCKEFEDILGAVDYYDSFRKVFATHTATPVTVTAYLGGEMEKKLQQTNKLLLSDKWLGSKAKKTKKIRKLLRKVKWLAPKNEAELVAKVYKEDIEIILMFASETSNGFTELESQVHEMRRKLRWLSIYAKSLNGLVQLADSELLPDADINFYLTEEVISSPYNKLQDPANNEYIVLLERNYFLALSWIISKLGKLKDEGLEIFALTEALQVTENIPPLQAHSVAINLLDLKENHLDEILKESSEVMINYIAKDYLKNLLIGVSKIAS